MSDVLCEICEDSMCNGIRDVDICGVTILLKYDGSDLKLLSVTCNTYEDCNGVAYELCALSSDRTGVGVDVT